MRILISGAGGFVGNHLAKYLGEAHPQATLYGTTLMPGETVNPAISIEQQIDLKDFEQLRLLLTDSKPDVIYHLAAQAFVPRSFIDPWETLENNIRAQVNILQACLQLQLRPRILIVSSAEIYGAVAADQLPFDRRCRDSSHKSLQRQQSSTGHARFAILPEP